MYIHMDATSKETPKLANDGKMVKKFMLHIDKKRFNDPDKGH